MVKLQFKIFGLLDKSDIVETSNDLSENKLDLTSIEEFRVKHEERMAKLNKLNSEMEELLKDYPSNKDRISEIIKELTDIRHLDDVNLVRIKNYF